MYRIAMIFSPMDNSYTMRQAVKNLGEETADIQVNFLNSYETDDDQEKRQKAYKILADADFIFIFIHGGLTQFKSFSEIMETFSDKRFFIWSGCDDENQLVLKKSNISLLEHSKIAQYALDPSDANCLNLFKYLGSVYGKLAIDYEEAVHSSWEGIYQRNGQKPLEEVLEEARKSAKPVIGILVYSRYMHEKNMAHIDALIDEVTVQGGFALPVYTASVPNPAVGCKGAHWVVDNILMQNGERIVDAIINTMGYSLSILSDPGDGSRTVEKSIFEPIDVPVIQGFSTYQTYEDWETNLRGIDAMSFPGSVYYPEFDGQIISFTFAYTKFIKDEIGDRRIHLPIADRVKSLCELAISWARLSHIENEDKKVAILFHNMPPRNDMIGCAFGLDTPKSVYDMVEAFKADGIQTEYEFVDGDDIINRIIDAVSNDERWLPAEKVIVAHPDTDITPDSGTSTASRQTVITGETTKRASLKLKADLGKYSLTELEGKEYYEEFIGVTDPMGSDKPNPVSHLAYGYATQVVVLDEDGKVKKVVAAHDVGRAINPTNVEGQIEGGVVMGLGYGLTEDTRMENGKPQARYGTLGLWRATDVPEIETILIEKNKADLAYGAKGVGEIPLIPTSPAAQAAYYKRDGIFRTSLPLEQTAYRK